MTTNLYLVRFVSPTVAPGSTHRTTMVPVATPGTDALSYARASLVRGKGGVVVDAALLTDSTGVNNYKGNWRSWLGRVLPGGMPIGPTFALPGRYPGANPPAFYTNQTFLVDRDMIMEAANPDGTKAGTIRPIASALLPNVALALAGGVLAPYEQGWLMCSPYGTGGMKCPYLYAQLGWEAQSQRPAENIPQVNVQLKGWEIGADRQAYRPVGEAYRPAGEAYRPAGEAYRPAGNPFSIGQEQGAAYCQGCRRIHS